MTSHKLEVSAIAIIAAAIFCSMTRGNILPMLNARAWDIEKLKTILIIAGGCLLFFFVFAAFFRRQSVPYELDWTVDNTALAYDPNYGCVLVKARNTHKIDGRDKNVSGNLPGNILFFGKARDGENLYVWDYYHKFGTMNDPVNSVRAVDERNGFNWIPFDEPMEIVPRGARKDWQGALADEVAGWSIESYVLPKGERPSIANPGIYTGEEVEEYMSRRKNEKRW